MSTIQNLTLKNQLREINSDALLMIGNSDNTDLYYVSNFISMDSYTYIQTNSSEILFVPDMELNRAKIESRISDIRTISKYKNKKQKYKDFDIAYCDALIEIFKQEQIKKISVLRDFSFFFANRLKEAGFEIIAIESPFKKMRAKKNDLEIKMITAVQNACDSAMEVAINMIENSTEKNAMLYYKNEVLTSESIRTAIEYKLLEFGCNSENTIVACGEKSSNPHWAGTGALAPNESIVIDIFPRSKTFKYYADMTRTVCKGTPSKELNDMYDAVLFAQTKALELVKPGINCSEIHNAVCDVFERKGYETIKNNSKIGYIHSTGHGVGLDIHELPNVGNTDVSLEVGNIITIEPGLYYPNIGGIRIEDLVVVTENGCNNLTKYKKQFVV